MTSIVFVVIGGIVTFLVVMFCEKKRQTSFNARFPPISDAEFLARCRPGTNPEVALKVRRIVSNQLGVDYERIYPSSRFVEDLDAG